jgi:hypothetical protein
MEFHHPQPQTLSHHLSFDMQSRDAHYEPEAFESTPEIVGWNQETESYDIAFGAIQWDKQDPCDDPTALITTAKKVNRLCSLNRKSIAGTMAKYPATSSSLKQFTGEARRLPTC